MSEPFDREEGRQLFGRDAPGYEAARPDYPDRVYEVLCDRCGVGPEAHVLEVGAGPGLATAHLLDAGASVVAVEPDPALAAHLRARFPPPAALDVRVSAFEDVAVDDDSFDVGAAATSFHWIEPGVGLAKVRRALRPGGWWAMWWNVFGDPELPDPFHDATFGLLGQLPGGPSAGARGVPFALDRDERVENLAAAGFEAIAFERLTWTLTLTTAGVGALYATFSPISRLDPEPRAAVLERLEAIADHDFGGRVDRQVVTPVYTARNSARG